MRLFSFLTMMLFSSALTAAEFQLPDFALGTAKAEMKAEVLAKTSVTVFETEAKIDTVWADDKLAAVQLTFYHGADYPTLRQKTTVLLQQLTTEFGAISWVSAEANPASAVTPEQQLELLDQVMKTAAETVAGYKQSHLANSTLVLDFQPTPQPDNSRLHLTISYSSISAEYRLELFIDDKKAPERTSGAIVNLEAF